MSIREVTMYKVVCDAAGCGYETNDVSDFAAWGEAGHAEDEWRDADHQVTEDGKHFCDKHRVPECCVCGSSKVVVNDERDGSGDWYCDAHRGDREMAAPAVDVSPGAFMVVPVDDDRAELLCDDAECAEYAQPVGSAHAHRYPGSAL